MSLIIQLDNELDIFIDVYDYPLAKKWYEHLKHLIENSYTQEESYCFLGWPESHRNVEYMCSEITKHIETIRQFDWHSVGLTPIHFQHHFTPETCVMPGTPAKNSKAGKPNHTTMNWLHRYFEELQGTHQNPSPYYMRANEEVRNSIKHLNLLCHEMESFCLSKRKLQLEPEWVRPSQLMCWDKAPRFKLEDEDYSEFGLDAIGRDLGGVYMGVNKDVGKTYYEIWRDEGGADLDNVISIATHSTMYGTGDFDIEWGATISGEKYEWHQNHISEFREWLIRNGLDPEDKKLAIGHPKVGQVDLRKSFGTEDFLEIYDIVKNNLKVTMINTL